MSSTRKPGPQGAADRLSETLDTVRANPVPANTALRPAGYDTTLPTTGEPFDFIPAADAHLLEVRAGVERYWALGEARSLLEYVADRLQQSVEDGVEPSEAYGLQFALRAAIALYAAAGAEV